MFIHKYTRSYLYHELSVVKLLFQAKNSLCNTIIIIHCHLYQQRIAVCFKVFLHSTLCNVLPPTKKISLFYVSTTITINRRFPNSSQQVVVVVCPFPTSSSLFQVLRVWKAQFSYILYRSVQKIFRCQSGGVNSTVEQVRNILRIHSTVWTT